MRGLRERQIDMRLKTQRETDKQTQEKYLANEQQRHKLHNAQQVNDNREGEGGNQSSNVLTLKREMIDKDEGLRERE